MIRQLMDEIGAMIAQYNPYFDKYFTGVELNEETGLVNNGEQVLFPTDINGNYFYIRVPSKLGAVYTSTQSIHTLDLSVSLVVVACMRDADPYELYWNIVSTIGRGCSYGKRFTDFLVHNEDVIMQELAHWKDEDIAAALQRSADFTLVSVNFTLTYTQPFLQLNCIEKPCTNCT